MAAKKSTDETSTAAKKTTAKKSTAKKSAAKKTTAKKATAKKATAKNATAKKATAKKKSTAKKSAAKKATAKKSTAKKSTAKKSGVKTTSTKAASAKKSTAASSSGTAFSKKFLEAQHALLLEERAKAERQSRSLRDEAESLVEDFQSGDVQFDEESGEGDTLNVAREQDLMMSSQADNKITEIDHALAKFDLGTYGICEVSGDPIPEARLEAIPWARERVEYKVGGLTRR